MDCSNLAIVLRRRADALNREDETTVDELQNAELIRVLARLLEGKPLEVAFGTPEHWGYDTPICDALRTAYDS